MPMLLPVARTRSHRSPAHFQLTLRDDNGFIETEVNMNAITISVIAIVITAALAFVTPVTRHVQHESGHVAALVSRG